MQNARQWALCAGLLVSSLPAQAVAAGPVMRYVCKLLDGSVVVVPADLSSPFDDVASRCTPFEAPPARHQPLPARPLPMRPSEPWATASSGDWVTLFAMRAVQTRTLLRSVSFAALIDEAGKKHRVDPRLLAAMIDVESDGQPHARSPKGALGLMQLMPATAERYGVSDSQRLLDPAVNIDTGTRYLSDLLRLFDGSTELAVAAYNAGEMAVLRHGRRVPPYPETQQYVQRVMALLP